MTALIFVVLLGGLAAITYIVSKKDTPTVQTPPVTEDPIESPGKPDVPEVFVEVFEKITPEALPEVPKVKTQKSKTVTKKTSKKVTKK